MKFKVLILTDHKSHSGENSLYDLAVKMLQHELTAKIDIVSRVNSENDDFFNCKTSAPIYATEIDESFSYNIESHPLSRNYVQIDSSDYDLVWLRLPPPLSKNFLNYISSYFQNIPIINDPKGIYETGSKEFLINFETICPPLEICRSIDDINKFKSKFPIVLKPFREYGGRGIVKINGEEVSEGNHKISFETFAKQYEQNPIEYLAVKFLKNVDKGDKRIIVVKGKILGASLRLPPKDSWICNVSMGGSSNIADVDPEEEEIVRLVDPMLSKMGIVMYGIDTLVDDEGKRVLSEINTTSIGGLPQVARFKKQPLVEEAIDLIWKYYLDKFNTKKKEQ